MPDHYVVMVEFEYVCQVKDQHKSSTQCDPIYRKYSFQNPSDNFLNNDIWNTVLCEIIDTLERNIQTRDQLNALYEKLVQSIINEMWIPIYNLGTLIVQ